MFILKNQVKLPIPKFYLAVFFILLALMGLRTHAFREQFQFIPDNGLESAIVREINLDRCSPMVGPMLSISDVYIPPTYFYYRYLITGGVFAPFFSGYLSNLLKTLAVVLLAGTVWLATNRRFFLVSLVTLTCSLLLFDTSRFMWHPNQVTFFLSISLFLLAYAKLKQRWHFLVGSFLMYWLATSIYPAPILLLPWYVLEIIRWPKPPERHWRTHITLGLGLLIATAIPFYLPQLIFEALNQWPTFQTLVRVVTQPSVQSAAVTQPSLLEMYHFVMIQILHLRGDWPGFEVTAGLVVLSFVVLGVVSILNQSHRWQFYFPYLPTAILIAQFLVLNHLLPGQLNQHWLSLFFIILIPSAFEAAYKLWALVPLRVMSILLCAVLCINNASNYWENQITPPPMPDQLIAKTHRMEHLESFWLDRGIRPKSILVLDRNQPDMKYTDTFDLQYAAMENWTLLHYQTLLPPMSKACNEYTFFEKPEIQKQAKNIFLLEPIASPPSPDFLLETFEKKFSFDLDETKRATWYISTAEVD